MKEQRKKSEIQKGKFVSFGPNKKTLPSWTENAKKNGDRVGSSTQIPTLYETNLDNIFISNYKH